MNRSKRLPSSKVRLPILLYASTRASADQYFMAKCVVPDAFISFKKGSRRYAVLNQLEYSRVVKESAFNRVLRLEDWLARAKAAFRRADAGVAEVIATLAKTYKMKGFRVPADFPAGLAFELGALGLEICPLEGTAFPEREVKTEEELREIRRGNRCSAKGLKAAENALRESVIRRGYLYFKGKRLTSERLKELIEIACLQAGSLSVDTIAAGGDQACDPHCSGSGPLKANELIIVDVFPRVTKSGYHGDMTRTFLKGKPSLAQRELVATVRGAQKQALKRVKTGIDGRTIHDSVVSYFRARDFQTTRTKTGSTGFFHGTGHGLGLEVHEAPRVSTVSQRLKRNAVVTIEPGLYYPGRGGCRIEDVVAVTDEGPKRLSAYHYKWIID